MNGRNPERGELIRQLKQKPGDLGLLEKVGDIFRSDGNFQEAMLHYFKATSATTENPDLLEKIGLCLEAQNLHGEASRYFRAAYDNGKRTVSIINKLVLSLRIAGRVEQSNQILKRYEASHKLPRRLLLISAMNYYSNGDLDNSEVFADMALSLNPQNTFSQGVVNTVRAAQESAHERKFGNRPKIAFHMNEGFHYAIMKPIFDVLKSHFDVIMTGDPEWIRSFGPSFVFVANKQAESLRAVIPKAKFVYTRHGLISKNFVYDAARSCDYVCVTSEVQQKQFVEEGGFDAEQVWLTGYAQMVPLFKKEKLPHGLNLHPKRKKVLYAPTYTAGLSSIPMLLPHINEGLMRNLGEIEFLIKLHPLVEKMHPVWFRRMRQISRQFDNIHLIENASTDIVPYLQIADILISDASSVMFQYLAMDRPIIAITNPERYATVEYDPHGIEWRWRDMAVEIDDVSALPVALQICLENPELRADKRAQYRKELFGSVTDGRTGERVLEYLKKQLPVSGPDDQERAK